jgi:hypothetical protein
MATRVASLGQAAKEKIEQVVQEGVKARFPAGAIAKATVLHYGDDPGVEPGQVVVTLAPALPDDGPFKRKGQDKGDDELGDEPDAFDAFVNANRPAIKQFQRDLGQKAPQVSLIEVRASGPGGHGKFRVRVHPQMEERGPDLTPVMARLGAADLEILDTLIAAGIAANRAEGVRWALARIRERPAYEQLRDRAREIEELKAQF